MVEQKQTEAAGLDFSLHQVVCGKGTHRTQSIVSCPVNLSFVSSLLPLARSSTPSPYYCKSSHTLHATHHLAFAFTHNVFSFRLLPVQNNPAAFAMTDRQKVEGAQKVHVEMNRLRMDMAIGRAPPLNESQLHHHLEVSTALAARRWQA